jgi:hypothetical protein
VPLLCLRAKAPNERHGAVVRPDRDAKRIIAVRRVSLCFPTSGGLGHVSPKRGDALPSWPRPPSLSTRASRPLVTVHGGRYRVINATRSLARQLSTTLHRRGHLCQVALHGAPVASLGAPVSQGGEGEAPPFWSPRQVGPTRSTRATPRRAQGARVGDGRGGVIPDDMMWPPSSFMPARRRMTAPRATHQPRTCCSPVTRSVPRAPVAQ